MNPDSIVEQELKGLQKDWWCLLALGLSFIVLGTLAISLPWVATNAVTKVLGMLLLIGGVAQLVSSFWAGQWSGFMSHFLVGLLYVVVGALTIKHPQKAAEALTLLMAAFFLITGVTRIIISLRLRFPNWGWTFVNGVITLLLGLFIYAEFDQKISLWLIGTFIGIEMIFNGWTWIMLSMCVRNLPKPTV